MIDKSNKYYQIASISLLWLWILGLFFSNALMSISTALFFLVQLIHHILNKDKKKWVLLQYGLLLIFLVYSLWSIYSITNVKTGIHSIVAKFGFLILAIIYGSITIKKKYIIYYMYFFIGLLILISIIDYIILLSDFAAWQLRYTKGSVLPTFIHHSKMGFLIVVAIILLWQQTPNKLNKHFYVSIVIIVYLIIYLHVLAVKTGLICYYLSLFFWIVYKLVNKEWYYAFLLLVPIFLYKISPTLQQKVNYFKYDLQQYKTKEILNYSDARRLLSYKIAYQIYKEHLVFGVGLTNIKTETAIKYKQQFNYFNNETMMYVHNSYLHILASCGTIGFILYSIGIFLILTFYIITKQRLIFVVLLLFLLCCCWDAFTEQLAGLSIFYLIILLSKHENE